MNEPTLEASRPLRVLLSYNKPREGALHFVNLFARSLREEGLQAEFFSPKAAFAVRLDVFNLHWPELLVSGSTPIKKLVKWTILLALLARIKLQGIPVVHTVHNREPHEKIDSRVARWLYDQFLSVVTLRVYLNEDEANDYEAGVVVLHGLYPVEMLGSKGWGESNWHEGVLFFGNLRRYKGIERLLEIYATPGELGSSVPLTVVGQSSDSDYLCELRAIARHSELVNIRGDYIEDVELNDLIARTLLVVLPYRQMYNSGAAILALSVGAPVLLPDSGANRALQREVGADWVHLFAAEDDSKHLANEILKAIGISRSGTPDLSRRTWEEVGTAYRSIFEEVVRLPSGCKPAEARARLQDLDQLIAHSRSNRV